MDWPTIRMALASVVVQTAGVAPAQVVWAGSLEQRGMGVGDRVVLSVNSIDSIGVDETRIDAPPTATSDQVVTRCGQRRFTWTIAVESQNQTAGHTARELIDRIRIRLGRESVLASLAAVGVGINEDLATKHIDALQSGRMVSVAIMDVIMNAVENDTDDVQGAGGWIAEVNVSGPVKDTDGSTLGTVTEDITQG